jgi:hypothetical protein
MILIAPNAEVMACASEAIPSVRLSEHVVVIPNAQWPCFPWEKCRRTKRNRRFCGHFLFGDDGQTCTDGEHFPFVSGADYYLFKKGDIEIVKKGPDAVVPRELL